MPIGEVLEAELGPVAALAETIAAVAVTVSAYVIAKLRFGWWRPRRPRR